MDNTVLSCTPTRLLYALRLRLAHFTTYFTMFLPATVFTGQTGEYSG